jgi:copper homeostasis protein
METCLRVGVNHRLLEVIVTSVEDAVAAEAGGADRLEIVRELLSDGLTPSWELVDQITKTVRIPARVMLRERADFVAGNQDDARLLQSIARRFSRLPIDGFVLGFLSEGRIDRAAVRAVLAGAPGMRATFHRAFEAAESPIDEIEALIEIEAIDRVLTSGGEGSWPQRAARLEAFQNASAGRLTVIAGGDMTAEGVRLIARDCSVREFHIGRAAREGERVEGVVSAEKVRRFRRAAGLE